MEDDKIVIDDTTNAGETAEEKVLRLEDANRKLYARTKTAEGFVQDSEGKWTKRTVEPKVSAESSVPKPSDFLKSDEFVLYREGYTPGEIDLIIHNGGAKILQDKTNPITLGLEAAKVQRSAEDAASRVTDSSSLSDVERKYSEQDMRNMSKEDLEKLIPHVVK